MSVLDWLQSLLGGGKGESRPPPLPQEALNLLYRGPIGDEDVLYQSEGRTPFLRRGREDMEIVATPRLPAENIDELIRGLAPGTFDAGMVRSRDDLSNAQFNFAPGYLRKTSGPQTIGLLEQILNSNRQ